MKPHSNPWDILGITPSASQEEIQQAYRRLAFEYHPDRGGDSKMFNTLTEAYQQLKNRKPVPILTQPKTTLVNLKLSIQQQIEGISDYIEVYDPSTKETLVIKVKIPAGAQNNDKIKIKYKGKNYIINILEKRDDVFTRQGFNIIMYLTIDIVEAMLGTDKTIIDPCGEEHVLKISPGTQNDEMFAISEKGLYNKKKRKRGNIYIYTSITIPKLDSENLEEFIIRLKNDRN